MLLSRKTFSSLFVFAGILCALIAASSANAQVNYSGDTSTGGTFLRPHVGFPPSDIFGDETNYHAFTFTPTTAGGYRFFSQSTDGHDPCLVLYRGSFDPNSPLDNALICNDDSLPGNFLQSSFVYVLEANQPYIVVTTGYSSLDAGTFTNTISAASVGSLDSDTTGDPTWNRPIAPVPPGPPITLSTTGTAVPYEPVLVRVSQTGHYAFHLGQPGPDWDSYIFLYEGSFNPALPLVNAKTGNDDLNDFNQSKFEFDLTANVNYFVVVTGFSNIDFGVYHLQVSGPEGSTITATLPRTISGTVTRANCPNLAFDVDATLHPSDNSGDLTRTVSVAADGTFSIKDVPAKNYQLKIKFANTLSRVVAANATSGNVSGLVVPPLLGGDADSINSYNIVDVEDLSRFVQAFDSDPSAPNWNPLTDFNCDDSIDVEDLSILVQNFDKEGEEI